MYECQEKFLAFVFPAPKKSVVAIYAKNNHPKI
jgi:hypothetical protein